MMEQHNFIWGHKKRYNDFSAYFRKIFNERVQKISVDAGFTCPNRDGTKGKGGCTYCNNVTFKPDYCNPATPVSKQLQDGIAFFTRKYDSIKFLAYFQAYTNTYAPFDDLKRIYSEALEHPGIVGLVISTRPDSISPEVLDYLAELSKEKYIMVELGLESHLDKTLGLVNRCHTFADSVRAIEETAKRGINNCAHLILGLPGESRADWLEQAKIISGLPVKNLKLHQMQIHRKTVMEKQYNTNPCNFNLFTVEEYTDLVVDYLELLNPQIIVERFVSEAPSEMVIAPKWGLKNFEFVAKVERRLKERDTWQGKRFNA